MTARVTGCRATCSRFEYRTQQVFCFLCIQFCLFWKLDLWLILFFLNIALNWDFRLCRRCITICRSRVAPCVNQTRYTLCVSRLLLPDHLWQSLFQFEFILYNLKKKSNTTTTQRYFIVSWVDLQIRQRTIKKKPY